MTKKDFLNALKNPKHTEVKLKLRKLRKDLKEMNWKLKYNYDKKTRTFYLLMYPTAMSSGDKNKVDRLLVPLYETSGIDLFSAPNDRTGEVFADIYIGSGGFLV
jgi:hypothetical protein